MPLFARLFNKVTRGINVEKDVKRSANLVLSNKNKPEYMSAFVKHLSDYTSQTEAITERLEGNLGIERNLLNSLEGLLEDFRNAIRELSIIIRNLSKEEQSILISKINEVDDFIKENFEIAIKNEARLYQGKSPRTHNFEKICGNMHRDADIYQKWQWKSEEDEKRKSEESTFRETISSLQQDKFDYQRLKEEIKKIVDYYKKEFKYIFKCFWDIQEQEYVNLCHIDYYFRLVYSLQTYSNLNREYNLPEILDRLKAVKLKIKEYVRQDYAAELNLDKLFEQIRLKFEAVQSDMEGIKRKKVHFPSGEIFFKTIKGNYPKKGIVFAPGTSRSYKHYEPLIFRLVMEGYSVCGFDLPSQGSRGNWKVGLMSEYIYRCVRHLRAMGAVEVCAIGHSVGAMAALHALGGYNRKLEKFLMKEGRKLMVALDNSLSMLFKANNSLKQQYESGDIKVYELVNLFEDIKKEQQRYEAFKKKIFAALKETRFNTLKIAGKIDALVLLAPPESIQAANMYIPSKIKPKPEAVQLWMNFGLSLDRLADFIKRKQVIEVNKSQPIGKDLEKLKVSALEIKKSDWLPFLQYLKDSLNPFGLMSLLDYFSKYTFIKYYTDKYIRDVPKVFLYGAKDAILKSSIKNKTLENSYKAVIRTTIGANSYIKSFAGMGHTMMKREFGARKRSYIAEAPQLQQEIIIFLNRVLKPYTLSIKEVA
ncbi:hypothetical protein HYX01_04430 [Candidatus Woesearchaeota archaeon]|nr:hypothetical protein [Candidatus Woesearchaeota archaeon]